MINFRNIDCMKLMKEYPDNYFDLAIVDPPYGIGEDGKSNHSRGSSANANKFKGTRNTTGIGVSSTKFTPKEWDRVPPNEEYFKELIRVSKNQIIFGANHFIENIPSANSSCWIVWDKVNNDTDQADCELAWCSFNTAVRRFEFVWNGMLQGDMKNKQERIQPTQKPIQLYTWILSNYAKKGDIILDTHAGSASSVIACHQLGYDIVASELDEEYYRNASQRVKEKTAQMELFS